MQAAALYTELHQTNSEHDMHVIVHRERLFAMLDVLLARWRQVPKQYPFNRKDAVIPQTVIPDELSTNSFQLACFYFYVCIYMRGGIESLQAFKALIQMWRKHPELFDPQHMAQMSPHDMQKILKEFIGWDSKAASINWVENSHRLVEHWEGNPLNLLTKLTSYARIGGKCLNSNDIPPACGRGFSFPVCTGFDIIVSISF